MADRNQPGWRRLLWRAFLPLFLLGVAAQVVAMVSAGGAFRLHPLYVVGFVLQGIALAWWFVLILRDERLQRRRTGDSDSGAPPTSSE